jgi:hypothetical protein
VQRNRIDAELSHIRRRDTTVRCRLADNSAYEQELRRHKLGLSPSVDEVKSDAVWRLLLDAAAKEPARQQALRDLVEEVDGREEWTKVVVFAPDGAAFAAAAAALRALRRPVVIGDPADAGSTDAILAFSRPDLRDPEAPRVLLLSFDHSSALNLQLVSHDGAPPPTPHAAASPPRPFHLSSTSCFCAVVFYSPLWGDDTNGVHAAANEQQAIGRVLRIGQRRDVNVHRILAKGPKGQETIEERVVKRNTSEWVMKQAVTN